MFAQTPESVKEAGRRAGAPCDHHRMKRRWPIPLVALAAVAAASLSLGCGSDSDGTEETEIPGGADHEAVRVIRDWVDELRAGHVAAAASYFSFPSIVENGTPPITLHERADAVAFNRSLPCGAILVRARPLGRYIAATFRLTERPGAGSCGSGTGNLARTAFIIREGKIAQWRRLPDPEQGEAVPQGPVV
jgi:hypothetical protein